MCVDADLAITAIAPSMVRLLDLARRVARVNSSVLITGESGVGKERVARLLHEGSARAEAPFIAVNCGAISEALVESELFGHAKGAFTGASTDRPGLFEAAHTGTLLLDEVGDISPCMQVKLLRVLQEREVRRVGENRTRSVDVRVIAATNRDLRLGVAAGTFRQDLYYRLRVVELVVPPLRERAEDIEPLARALLAACAQRMGQTAPELSPQVVARLVGHVWPGNVRELENTMERAIALSGGRRVEVSDLPDDLRQAARAEPGAVRLLDDVEKDYILAALAINGGNQTHTATQLGIGSATLYRKLKRYGVTAVRLRGDDVAPGSDAEAA
jgi:two-component system response regulator HydG